MTEGSASASTMRTSSDTSLSAGSSTGDRPELEPFRVPITFAPRAEPLENFVARVRIDQPYLAGVPPASIDFRDPDTAARIPFEVIETDMDEGLFDAWVLLGVWDDESAPTVIDLVVGNESGEPQSPWEGYEHVWHLDDQNVLRDSAGTADGLFSGYGPTEGLVDGVVGNARIFDAVDDVAEIPMIADPSPSVAGYGWARISALPSGEVPLFSRSDGLPDAAIGGDNRVDWAITVDQDGFARMIVRVISGVTFASSPVPISPPVEGWHHFAFTSDLGGNAMTLFVDGALGPAILSQIFTEISAPSVALGRWYGDPPTAASPALEGAVDELTILHRDLPFGWMAAVHLNQQTPSDSYTLGPKQVE